MGLDDALAINSPKPDPCWVLCIPYQPGQHLKDPVPVGIDFAACGLWSDEYASTLAEKAEKSVSDIP
jgi:hypothetical protein